MYCLRLPPHHHCLVPFTLNAEPPWLGLYLLGWEEVLLVQFASDGGQLSVSVISARLPEHLVDLRQLGQLGEVALAAAHSQAQS